MGVVICNQVDGDCDDFEECGLVICNQVDVDAFFRARRQGHLLISD